MSCVVCHCHYIYDHQAVFSNILLRLPICYRISVERTPFKAFTEIYGNHMNVEYRVSRIDALQKAFSIREALKYRKINLISNMNIIFFNYNLSLSTDTTSNRVRMGR